MKKTYFYYYGCVLYYSEITSLMQQQEQDDMYCFIFDQNLQYRKVGDIETTWQIVIGKELKILTDENPYHLDEQQPYMELFQKDIDLFKISKKEQRQIENALVAVGCYRPTKYWATYNYIKELGD